MVIRTLLAPVTLEGGISIEFINVFICKAKPEAGVFSPPSMESKHYICRLLQFGIAVEKLKNHAGIIFESSAGGNIDLVF